MFKSFIVSVILCILVGFAVIFIKLQTCSSDIHNCECTCCDRPPVLAQRRKRYQDELQLTFFPDEIFNIDYPLTDDECDKLYLGCDNGKLPMFQLTFIQMKTFQ